MVEARGPFGVPGERFIEMAYGVEQVQLVETRRCRNLRGDSQGGNARSPGFKIIVSEAPFPLGAVSQRFRG